MKTIKDKKKREEFLKAIASENILKTLRGKGYREVMNISERLFEKAKKA